MPRKKHSELAAGLFVLAALLVTVGVVLWLGAADLLAPSGRTAVFYVPQSAGSVGVIPGAAVTYGDAWIGRIVQIQPDPARKRCCYIARIDRPDIQIQVDANAVVVAPAVGQAKVVVTDLGQSDQPADFDHPVRLVGGMDQVMMDVNTLTRRLANEANATDPNSLLGKAHMAVATLGKAAGEAAATIANVRAQTDLANEKSIFAQVHRTAGTVAKAAADVAHQVDPNQPGTVMANINRAAGNLRIETSAAEKGSFVAKMHRSANDIGAIIADANTNVRRTLAAAAATAERIDAITKTELVRFAASLKKAEVDVLKILADFSVTSGEVKQMVVVNRSNVDEALDDLRQVSANLKSASKEIRREPWRLLYRPGDKELRTKDLFEAATAFSEGATELDQTLTKLEALQKLPAADPALQSTVEKLREQLKEIFAKFSKAENALWKAMEKE